jgi:excisionase family DNA binding protein
MGKMRKSKDIEDNVLYTVAEASDLLGITTQTVSNYLRNGELNGEKKGPKKKWHVPGSEIKKLLKDWNMLS